MASQVSTKKLLFPALSESNSLTKESVLQKKVFQEWLRSLFSFALCCFGFNHEVFAQTVNLEGLLEVTQSVQVMSLTNPAYNNSVPLIANKRTVVRAYFSTPTGTVTVGSGQLQARHTDFPAGTTFLINSISPASVAVLSTENGNLHAKRDNITKSLNFEIPWYLARPGTLTLTLTQVSGTGGTAFACSNCAATPVMGTFQSSPPLRLRIVPMQYDRGGTMYQPRADDYALLKSWLRRAYPIETIEEPLGNSPRFYDPAMYGDLFEDVNGDGITGNDDTCLRANVWVQDLRRSELPPSSLVNPWNLTARTHYYGLIFDGGSGQPNFVDGCSDGPSGPIPASAPNWETTAVGPTGSSTYGWDTDGSYGDWYGAHELSHTFGRRHLEACGCTTNATDYLDTSVDGQVWPLTQSSLSTCLSLEPHYVGFDAGDVLSLSTATINIPRAAVPGNRYDLMTYCHPVRWINPYTYNGILERLKAENIVPAISEIIQPPTPGREIFDPIGPVSKLETRAVAVKRCLETAKDPAALQECLKEHHPNEDHHGVPIRQGDFLHILATINFKNETGKILHADRVDHIIVAPQTPDKRVRLRITQSDGQMTSFPVEVRQNAETPPDKRFLGIIDANIPFLENIVRIELVEGGAPAVEPPIGKERSFASLEVTKKSPSVDEIVLPRMGLDKSVLEAPLLLTWSTHDDDSKSLIYTVQFSKDNGRMWQTLGIGLTNPELKIDPSEFEGLSKVKIKVIASDGFNKGEKIVTLEIPAKQ